MAQQHKQVFDETLCELTRQQSRPLLSQQETTPRCDWPRIRRTPKRVSDTMQSSRRVLQVLAVRQLRQPRSISVLHPHVRGFSDKSVASTDNQDTKQQVSSKGWLGGISDTLGGFTSMMSSREDSASSSTSNLSSKEKRDLEEEQRKRERQESMIIDMLFHDTLEVNDFMGFIEGNIQELESDKSWRAYLPGYRQKTGIEELEQMNATLAIFSEEERNDFRRITSDSIERVHLASGMPKTNIRDLLDNVAQLRLKHKWVQDRISPKGRFFRAKAAPMRKPDTMVELELRIMADSRGIRRVQNRVHNKLWNEICKSHTKIES